MNARLGRWPLLAAAGAAALAAGCSRTRPRLYTYPPGTVPASRPAGPDEGIRLLSPRQAYDEIRADPNVFLLCVAGREDYDRGHIRGSVLIPAPGLAKALEKNIYYPEINRGRVPRKDQPVIVYCWWKSCWCPAVPTFSDVAARLLKRRGYTRVGKIDGGMRAWLKAKLPVEKGAPSASAAPGAAGAAGGQRSP